MHKILVVEDCPWTSEAYKSFLHPMAARLDLVSTSESAIELAVDHTYDAAIVDLHLTLSRSQLDGLALIAQLHRLQPECKILATSISEERIYGARAWRAGASGYVWKAGHRNTLEDALRDVMNGRLYFEEISSMDMRAHLSDTERQIYRLLSEGVTRAEAIGRILHMSPSTVRTHRQRMRLKLGLESPEALITFALTHAPDTV